MYALLALSLVACSSGSGSGSRGSGVSPSQIVLHDFETDDWVLYTQHLDYPGNNELTIELKGVALCDGRMQVQGSTFTLFDFVGPCAVLNGDYAYRLTRKCQGYNQVQFVCGDTALLDIILGAL